MKYVKLNPKANIFHDPGTGLTVLRGQVVGITEVQARTGKIKSALAGGHLVYTDKPKDLEEGTSTGTNSTQVEELDATALTEKYKALIEKGATAAKIEKAFTLLELKAIAVNLELEPEENDTKATLVEAITAELS